MPVLDINLERYAYNCISLVCRYHCSDLTTLENQHIIQKSINLIDDAIPVIAIGSMSNLMSRLLQLGTLFHYSCIGVSYQ